MTPQTQFTPGPWRFEIPDSRKDFDEGFRWIHAADDTVVAKVRLIESDWGESKANARLIASAPSLYAALQECVAWFELDEYRNRLVDPRETEIGRSMLEKARKALELGSSTPR